MSHTPAEALPLYSELASDPVLCEMVELFVEEMPERIARLREHFEAQDWDALRRFAHQLKGAAGSYGFPQLTGHAAQLEAALLQPSAADVIGQRYETLIAQCGRATAARPE